MKENLNNLLVLIWNINGRSGYKTEYMIPEFIVGEITKEYKIFNDKRSPDIIILTEFAYKTERDFEKFKKDIKDKGYIIDEDSKKFNLCFNNIFIAIKKGSPKIDYNSIEFSNKLNTDSDELPNFLQVEMEFNGKNLIVIGTRINTSDTTKEDYERRGKELDTLFNHISFLKKSNKFKYFIVSGDFNNARIINRKDLDYDYDDCKDNKTGKIEDFYQRSCSWQKIGRKAKSNLLILKTPPENVWSYVNKNKFKFSLDHLITNNDNTVSFVDDGYIWDFLNKKNGYKDLKSEDNLEYFSLPDHAKLIGLVTFNETNEH